MLNEHAEAIALRSDHDYGFDPVTLLITLLPIVLNQCIKTEESNMSRVKSYVESRCQTESGREKTIKRLARRFRGESDELTREEAELLAIDTIDHFLEQDTEVVTSLCQSVVET
jgi:hypothetical protein